LSTANFEKSFSMANGPGRPELPPDPGSLGEAIKKARKLAGLTTTQLAERVGVNQSSISRIESGKTDPDRTTLIRLAQELKSHFGIAWLRPYVRKVIEIATRQIPIVAYVAGGKPIVEEISDQFVSVDPSLMKLTGDVVGLRVRGDSMVDQHILDADALICRLEPSPKQLRKGTIVVVDLKGERGATVKRWQYKGGMIYLYADKYAKEDEKQQFHDWEVGKVFEILGLIRKVQ
jgi:repressor LexA